jgi:DNA-binding response OmpR family regulator
LQRDEGLLPPGLCVLLVEDEPLIALDGEVTLQALGVADVVCVRTLADGLAALDIKNFHAALLDLRLGDQSSIPLATRLAALDVPIAFLTGFQGDALPAEFRNSPLLPKPFTPDQLGALMRKLIAGRN